ncbi:putative mechanosensitive channel protein [Shigella flexneri]|nr:putative mechanosensitive channel protein [Shigella flexneri 2a]SRH55523.1 putative mechanosensitive channel protein [Shigella flexneri 2b]SRJ36458.1 putative mechanosensitive channel protein [Shigella flexneri]SRF79279.1 putative mechanosensitive channel protein [Shigella flexneri 2a]SRF94306.1 putative mechanosensitive channel protein [Shigella flexneri 2a]
MRWILFILFCLLGAPAHAVSIPGVTTTTTTDSTTEPAPEPDIEQKKRPMAHWRMCWITTPRVKS